MNSRLFLAPLALAFVNLPAYAQCTGTALTNVQLSTVFSGKTVSFNCVSGCDAWMAGTSVDWHETHQGTGGGNLIEIGTGAGGIQPTATVGTWTTEASDVISYTYTGDGTYTYNVYLASGNLGNSGSTYNFCSLPGGSTHKATGTID